MDKLIMISNILIMIGSIVLVILYGTMINDDSISYYICGICWMGVAGTRLAQIILDITDNIGGRKR